MTAPTISRGQHPTEAHTAGAPAPKLGPDHESNDAQSEFVRTDQLPDGQWSHDRHERIAAGGTTDWGHMIPDPHRGGAPVTLLDPLLALAADTVDDLEKTRIAAENRLRQLTRDEPDSDGEMRGFALTETEAAPYAAIVDELVKVEHAAVLELQRRMRKHPLGPWVKSQVGLGEKQAARLLAAIGDPYWNTLHDRPRTVSELWAFCGYDPVDGVAKRRTRGQRSNWSADAKMRAYLIAESCVKQTRSPYRTVYDAGRAKYANAMHAAPCVRCGPAGKPAAEGSPLSLGHQHARALRLVAKEVLKELWREARALHEANALGGE